MEDQNQKDRKGSIIERDLVEKSKAGDRESFTLLIDRYMHIYNILANQYVHQHEDSEEIVQDSILKIYQKLKGLQDPEKFQYWSYHIVKNAALDFLRKQKRESRLQSDIAHAEGSKISMRQSGDDIRVDIDKRNLNSKIYHGISRLPEKYRDILILHYSEDLNCREIGERLNLETNTVEVRLHRAKKQLRTLLKDIL